MTHEGRIHDAHTLMHDEIEEIPDAVRRLVADQADQFSRVVAGVRAARPRLAIIAARGTSDHAAIYAKRPVAYSTWAKAAPGGRPSASGVWRA